jgi:Holliday junction resolvase RusA-like endonuclease
MANKSFYSNKRGKGNASTAFTHSHRDDGKRYGLDFIKNTVNFQPIEKCFIVAQIFWATKHKRDIHNVYIKPFLDGLVDAGLFVDDNHTIISSVDYIFGGYDKENPRLELFIFQGEKKMYSLFITTDTASNVCLGSYNSEEIASFRKAKRSRVNNSV